MAFGRPTRYWQLNPDHIPTSTTGNKRDVWDRSVKEASDEYKMRMVYSNLNKLNDFYLIKNLIIKKA